VIGTTPLWKNDPYAELIAEDPVSGLRNTVIYDPGATPPDGFQIATWNELVVYEIHVGSFNPAGGGASGTFAQAAAKLDYLRDLGVNAVEIMPAGEFGVDPSLGYDPDYIFAVEDAYGGPDAFKQFLAAAHQRGIAVIMDVVYNHIGPDQSDLWQFDGWNQNGMGGIYFYEDGRAWTDWGLDRPDYGRGEVRQYLHDNALWWLQSRGVDGLRWDAVNFIRNIYGKNNDPANDIAAGWGLITWINRDVQAAFPSKISIAEDLQGNQAITQSANDGGAGFNAQWAADFFHPVRGALTQVLDEWRDMTAIQQAIQTSYNGDAFRRVIYTESHDEVACINRKECLPNDIDQQSPTGWAAAKRSTLGAALVFTAPGIPLIFQGQEFLATGCFDPGTALDWSNVTTHAGIVQLYRDLMHLRRNWFNTTRGLRAQHLNVFHVNHNDKVIAFHRWDQGGPGDDVVIVANFANRAYDSYSIGFPRPGSWRVRFNSDWNGYAPDFANQLSYDTNALEGSRDGMPWSGNVGIGKYTVIILSQDN
jgi:1,4-alpha-glucan branching enzyme